MTIIREPFGSDDGGLLKNIGTVATGSTVLESGDGAHHKSIITVDTTLGVIAGGANLGLGKLVYTLPAGAILITGAYMSIALTAVDGNIDDDTPKVGIGTVIASGVIATLTTATFQNILTEQTAADCLGTATVKAAGPTAAVPLEIAVAGAHTIYLNFADGWKADGEAACPVAGTIILFWDFII